MSFPHVNPANFVLAAFVSTTYTARENTDSFDAGSRYFLSNAISYTLYWRFPYFSSTFPHTAIVGIVGGGQSKGGSQ